ncbi:MAG: cobyrinate a,c-diamide synthase, partial [Rhodospirillales bacterium]
MNQAWAPGLVIAAPASGSGKTVVTLGLLSHLAETGRRVASAKAGPDYIDPAFHAAATGQACLNLDPWAMRAAILGRAAAWLAQDADIVVCEGVMGLFDGAFVNKGGNDGSTAALARLTGWPVVLVIDARAQAASAAAVAKGFATFRPGVEVGGIVFNRIGGDRHGEILRQASEAALPDIPVLGCLPRADGLALPARHLGLVQAREHPDLSGFIARARALIAEHLDTDALVALARPLKTASSSPAPSLGPPLDPIGQHIAVARDEAFGFSYPLVIEG